ncbi:glycosyltransferase family 2 protein [uncultured Nocardioides sp.]|uniref:glycosyltransferase family 2 protein n=1 Tax=uncultured Nocardioides sp. TaxID=198441 RepID=UPI00260258AB|nr:glycosyltransferase family 2 protein [uncultured Nocardioides sp.]
MADTLEPASSVAPAAGTSSGPPSALLGEVSPDAPGPVLAPGRVAVVLVSHDGARWLPTVLDGLASQRVSPWRVVAVDTGSRDDSLALLDDSPAVDDVLRLRSDVAFPGAVAAGYDALRAAGLRDDDWLWLLHDDSTPDPAALEQLMLAAGADPGVDLLGPKLREWPSLRRLLELGVTISGTGRRETGLERGEYDQGQHDDLHDVLAVNTAGLLVRAGAWEALGGLDERLPVFGNDVDLGWRAAAAGRRTVVVPAAVVFHAEAAHRGVRRTPLTGRHTHYAERRASLYTLLVNASARSLPFRVLRLALGTLLRMVGFLLLRSPGEALDELAALVAVYRRPGEVRAGRRDRAARRQAAAGSAGEARADRSRELLAPAWLPYRHGLDVVGDVLAAATQQASDVAERRRDERAVEHAARTGTGRRNRHQAPAAVLGAVGDDDDLALPADRGLVSRFLASPVALAVTALVLVALVGARAAWGPVSGGALAPAPAGAGDWWTLHLATWHPLGLSGSDVPAPPYVVVMALLASLLLGSATAAVSAVLVLAVPLALWGAWRFLRVAARLADPGGAPAWLLAAGSGAYALVPVTSGAWGQGRLGVVVVAALLPWIGHAALGFLDPEPDRRRRAGWRTGLLLTAAAAFVPTTWLVAAAILLVVLVVGFVLSPRGMRSRSAWGPLLVALAVAPLLLSPWLVGLLLAGAPEGLLLEAGRPPVAAPGPLDLLTGRVGGPDPDGVLGPVLTWLGVVPVVLALLALGVRRTRGAVVTCWAVALVVVGVAAALALVRVDLGAALVPAAVSPAVPLLAGAAVTAAVAGAAGAGGARGRGPFRLLLGAALAVVAVLGAAGFVLGSTGQPGELAADDPVPAYMTQSALEAPGNGVLVVTGDLDEGLTYVVRRGDGTTLGEAEVEALADPDPAAEAAVATLLASPTDEAVAALPTVGVSYVVLPPPADGRVAAGLDAVDGLVQAGAEDRSTRAWEVQVEADGTDAALDAPADATPAWVHVLLLVVQLLLLVVVAVLCGPSRKGTR